LLLVLVSLSAAPSFAQENERYFPETGHWVVNDFLRAYQNARDPLLVYGYPITEAFRDAKTGLILQYFEKARFELHPEAGDDRRVQLTPLGELLYLPGTPVPQLMDTSTCQTFPQVEFSTCHNFLDFFNRNGGIQQFGYPVSNLELLHGRFVQYFQAARLEYWPERPYGQRVVVSNFGRQYFEKVGENSLRLQSNNAIQSILDLQVFAFPAKSVAALQDEQNITVIVIDQTYHPVAGVKVTLTVQLPSGREIKLAPENLTDEQGIVSVNFPLLTHIPGLAYVSVDAAYSDLRGKTTTAFRLWW
jgi:hypothetical protein